MRLRHRAVPALLGSLLLALASQSGAQPAHLVKDVRTGVSSPTSSRAGPGGALRHGRRRPRGARPLQRRRRRPRHGAVGGPARRRPARSLRFRNPLPASVVSQVVRVRSGPTGCGAACGADDTYRIRAFETTTAIPRFNNSASQVTVLVLQNPSDAAVAGAASFWSASGALLASRPFDLGPRQTLVLNTSAVAALAGQSGAITIAHDGRYGELAGKAVALEPATGFSFDSPMLWRPVR